MPVKASTTIGLAIRYFRTSNGVSAEDLARACRFVGLSWSRPTLAAVEAGNRGLLFEEVLALPIVFEKVEVHLSVLDLVGEDGIDLTPRFHATQNGVSLLFNGGDFADSEDIYLDLKRLGVPSLEEFARDILSDHPRLPKDTGIQALVAAEKDEATQKASRRLGQSIRDVSAASIVLWGRSLTEERNARVGEQDAEEPSLRALRGRATRLLLEELRTYFEPTGGDA